MSTLLSARPVREHMGHLGLEIMCLEMTPGFSEIHLFKLISLQLIISRGALIEKNKQHGHVWSSSHHTWSPAACLIRWMMAQERRGGGYCLS